MIGLGTGVSGFLAAATMTAGPLVTAPTAKADFDDLLDPIIQPLLTSVTDGIAGAGPSAAADLSSWTDSMLSMGSAGRPQSAGAGLYGRESTFRTKKSRRCKVIGIPD